MVLPSRRNAHFLILDHVRAILGGPYVFIGMNKELGVLFCTVLGRKMFPNVRTKIGQILYAHVLVEARSKTVSRRPQDGFKLAQEAHRALVNFIVWRFLGLWKTLIFVSWTMLGLSWAIWSFFLIYSFLGKHDVVVVTEIEWIRPKLPIVMTVGWKDNFQGTKGPFHPLPRGRRQRR